MASKIKETLIEAATALIVQSGGDVSKVTSRAIAEKAMVGVGLINYHFQSKANLLTVCVQRIIKQVIFGFSLPRVPHQSASEHLTACAIQVFDFLFEHKAISRISILDDFAVYSMQSNSVKTQKGFIQVIGESTDQKQQELLCFILTAAMQAAFLGADVSPVLLGYDFGRQADRHAFISALVKALFPIVE